LQQVAEQLHASAELIDAATGQQGARIGFEVYRDGVFPAILDRASGRPLDGLEANELAILAREQLDSLTKEGNAKGLELTDLALARDPRSSAALWVRCRLYREQVDHGYAPAAEAMARWGKAATTLVDFDPNYAWGHVELAFKRIVFRIGVNLGDVVVEGDDLLGDGVNVAARLEQLCEPGGVLVSGTAFDHLQGRLGMPLEFTGEQQVKNIARPVRAYRVRLDGVAAGHRTAWSPSRRTHRLVLTAAAALFAVVFLGGVWHLWPVDPPPGRPSIPVLPLANLAGDARWERFADGITEDLITDLARDPDLRVIARNSTMTYKGKAVDVRQVGQELGVRYVLEGSLQAETGRVRVTAQLIDWNGLTSSPKPI
jgi:TolB-like protein